MKNKLIFEHKTILIKTAFGKEYSYHISPRDLGNGLVWIMVIKLKGIPIKDVTARKNEILVKLANKIEEGTWKL